MKFLKIVSLYNKRYIDTKELIDLLDKNKYTLDVEIIEYLIDGIKALYEKYYIEKSDEISKSIMKEEYKALINLKKDRLKRASIKEDEKNNIKKLLEYIDRDKYFDNNELYTRVMTILVDCPLFAEESSIITTDEVIDLSCSDVVLNTLFNIGETNFNIVVEKLVKEDKREALWNMAYYYSYICLKRDHFFIKFNYNYLDIMRHYINKKDEYYIKEMLNLFSKNKEKYDELKSLLNN